MVKNELQIMLRRFCAGLLIFLLVALIALASLPLLPNNALGTYHLLARQRVLEQRLIKDTLILAYRTDPTERASAIGEMQVTLPIWEQVQRGLLSGDASLGISPNLPGDVKQFLLQAQPDYTYLDASLQRVLAHPTPMDQFQVTILLQHDPGYFVAVGQAVSLFNNHLALASQTYFLIDLSLVLSVALVGFFYRKVLLVQPQEIIKEPNPL